MSIHHTVCRITSRGIEGYKPCIYIYIHIALRQLQSRHTEGNHLYTLASLLRRGVYVGLENKGSQQKSTMRMRLRVFKKANVELQVDAAQAAGTTPSTKTYCIRRP